MIRCLLISMISSFTFAWGYTSLPSTIMPKKTIYFFPASIKNSIPHELYHTFIDSLRTTYDIKIASSEQIQPSNDEEVLLLSHSSGANQLMQIYENLPNSTMKKAVLIDPLDFQRYSISASNPSMFSLPRARLSPWTLEFDVDAIDDKLHSFFERDYLEEMKTYLYEKFQPKNSEPKGETNGHILLLNHKKSSKWRMFPVIPPIHYLKMELNALDNTTIIQKDIDDFSHFDILDRPWANGMNNIIMSRKVDEQNTPSYYETIIPTIDEFYNN